MLHIGEAVAKGKACIESHKENRNLFPTGLFPGPKSGQEVLGQTNRFGVMLFPI